MPDPDLRGHGYAFHRVSASPPDLFQVMGERGSGTNVIRKLIERNTTAFRTEGLGWKHGFPVMPAIPQRLIVVCVVRDARKWALSMHKRPWHQDPRDQALGFSDFIRAPWRSVVDRPEDFEAISDECPSRGEVLQYDRDPITGLPFSSLFALRRAKLAALRGIANRGCSYAFVQMEHVLADPEDFMIRFREHFDLMPRPRPFQMISRSMGQNMSLSVEARPKTPDAMSEADLAFMRGELDLEDEALCGYDY